MRLPLSTHFLNEKKVDNQRLNLYMQKLKPTLFRYFRGIPLGFD